MRTPFLAVPCSLLIACVGRAQAPDWKLVAPTTSPPAIGAHAMAYDSARQRTVLYGGLGMPRIYSDTWEYDGKTWTKMKPRTIPAFAFGHSMAYDSVRRRTVMVGRFNGSMETFDWDGVNWTQIKTKNAPAARTGQLMVYDSVRQRVVLYGGQANVTHFKDTWEFDGTNWKSIKTLTNPGYRARFGMAYDSNRRRTVVFGGNYQPWDTWEWDGVQWTRIRRTKAPWARVLHAMAYDSARQRVLLFGGNHAVLANDLWEWDGNTWTELKPKTVPQSHANHAMVYDSVRQRLVVFGGTDANGNLSDTWEWGGKLTLTANTSTISFATGGSQRFTIDAGVALRNKPYCIFGTITGSIPGIALTGIHIPLNPDHYTDLVIKIGNSREFTGFKGVLSATGTATASLNVPKGLPAVPTTLHHAFVVYDGTTSQIFTASNPVTVNLR
jgi:photosystem II stability/assembly factor-like uncharacterized protein